MALGCVARAAGEHVEPGVEQRQQLARRQRTEPGRGELDRERNPLEPVAHVAELVALGVDGRACRGGARAEKLACRARLERRDIDHALGREPQRPPARREHGEAGSRVEQPGHRRGAVDEMLEVVEHEQELASTNGVRDELGPARRTRLAQPKRTRDRGQQQARVLERREVDDDGAVGEPAAETMRELDRDSRLPDPARADERDQPRARIEQLPLERSEHVFASDRRRVRRRDAERLVAALLPHLERRVLVEDAPFELAELGRRLEPQLVDENGAPRAIGGERVGLAAAAVQREHQLAAQSLVQRMLGHEPLEVLERLGVAAEAEVGLEAPLHAREPEVVEPRRLLRRELIRREVSERVTAPEIERAAVQRPRQPCVPVVERVTGIREEPLEPDGVALAVLELDQVAGSARDEPPRRQYPPEL